MATSKHKSSARPGKLSTPARNHYFYGKLMDACHFELEQTYSNDKRWLLNRLALGSGVLCGLDVRWHDDGHVVITPGVAIDRLGREIIVPVQSRPIDIYHLTDDCGRPTENTIAKSALICLAYHECESELVPVLVGDCDTKHSCAPSLICERYKVLVLEDGGTPPSIECELRGLFGQDKREGIQAYDALIRQVSQSECEVEGGCDPDSRHYIPLASAIRTEHRSIINTNVRPLVYSNALLFQMIVCLAERVEECCREVRPPLGKLPQVVAVGFVRYFRGALLPMQPSAWLENPRTQYIDKTFLVDNNLEVNAVIIRFSSAMNPLTIQTGQGQESTLSVVASKRGETIQGAVIKLNDTDFLFWSEDTSPLRTSFPQPNGIYTLTLSSGSDGIQDQENHQLDGSGDGKPSDFIFKFTVGNVTRS